MNGTTGRAPRLIVGISWSRESWWALAWATGEARQRGARLLLVHVFQPPDNAGLTEGHELITTAIQQAVGDMPPDVVFERAVIPGHPAVELARLAHGADMIVFGARHRGWVCRRAAGSVPRACAQRANCPVIIVPEPSPSALTAALHVDVSRGRWRRWLHHRDTRAVA